MNNFFAMSYSSYPHFSTGPGYDDLAYIANMEGLTGLHLPDLPAHSRVNVVLRDQDLAVRTKHVSRKSKVETTWPGRRNRRESLYPSISTNVDLLRGNSSVKRFAYNGSIPVQSQSGPAESKLATLDRARRLLGEISRHYTFPAEQMGIWDHVIEGLLKDSIVEELTIIVMQQTAYFLGQQHVMLEGVPKSIMECENLVNRV
ncbi:hypothetical protein PCL_06667 [Purpureocillium lilacinum]|uniref:Uncharacterized protein n=1 Tax=Purpureocillium lilacinum TaxID=33203 RepID=A0A2U3ENC6_PURLI|nr:hypothetical protein PCL_06667 [Purpureocillium lilacinum]